MSAAEAPSIWVGGRYELLERLGQGTTCEVHLARTVRKDGEISLVALRRPLAAYATDPRFVEELLASARRASQLLHPGIARVLDVSTDPRTPFVATEYVHGEQLASLQRRLVPGQRPLDVLLRVIAHAAEAVEHAHAARTPLVHGSLTPQNLFVAYDGEVRVADFGTPRPSVGPDDVHNREHGGIAYWSPEQAAQRMFEAPADVFALGVILWECITQRRLFSAATRAETRALVKRCEVPRPGDMTDCPAALERLVMRCLARDPHDRFPSVGVLADELTDLLDKRRRDASTDAIRRLMQDLFAQRKAGRDATLRRAMHPSRESYAPLAAASPSILPGDLASTISTRDAPSRAAAAGPRPPAAEESGPRPVRSTAPSEDREAVTSSTPPTTRVAAAPSSPANSLPSTPTATATAAASSISTAPSPSTALSTATPPVSGSPPATPASSAVVGAVVVGAVASEPSAVAPPARAPRGERSAAAWGGFVAIGLGLLAVLGVLGQVLTRPRTEAAVMPPATSAPRLAPPSTESDRAREVSAPPSTSTAASRTERDAPPDEAPSAEVVRAEDAAAIAAEVARQAPALADLEDPREEPPAEPAAFPTLDDDHGTLEIVCRPAAEIFVDNRSLGLTPRIVDVPDGPIAIGLRSTGPGHPWRTLRRTVEPRATLSIPMTDCP